MMVLRMYSMTAGKYHIKSTVFTVQYRWTCRYSTVATTATALNRHKKTIPNPKNTKRPPSRPLSTAPTQSCPLNLPLLFSAPLLLCLALTSHGSRLDSATGETHLFRGFNSFTSSPLLIVLFRLVSVSLTSHLFPPPLTAHPLRPHKPPIQPHLLSLRVGICITVTRFFGRFVSTYLRPRPRSSDFDIPIRTTCFRAPGATLRFVPLVLSSGQSVWRIASASHSLTPRNPLHDGSHCARQF